MDECQACRLHFREHCIEAGQTKKRNVPLDIWYKDGSRNENRLGALVARTCEASSSTALQMKMKQNLRNVITMQLALRIEVGHT